MVIIEKADLPMCDGWQVVGKTHKCGTLEYCGFKLHPLSFVLENACEVEERKKKKW